VNPGGGYLLVRPLLWPIEREDIDRILSVARLSSLEEAPLIMNCIGKSYQYLRLVVLPRVARLSPSASRLTRRELTKDD
jgi:hypothetical protein